MVWLTPKPMTEPPETLPTVSGLAIHSQHLDLALADLVVSAPVELAWLSLLPCSLEVDLRVACPYSCLCPCPEPDEEEGSGRLE